MVAHSEQKLHEVTQQIMKKEAHMDAAVASLARSEKAIGSNSPKNSPRATSASSSSRPRPFQIVQAELACSFSDKSVYLLREKTNKLAAEPLEGELARPSWP